MGEALCVETEAGDGGMEAVAMVALEPGDLSSVLVLPVSQAVLAGHFTPRGLSFITGHSGMLTRLQGAFRACGSASAEAAFHPAFTPCAST